MPSCQRCLQPSERLVPCGSQALCDACASRWLQSRKAVRKAEKKKKQRGEAADASTSLRLHRNEAFTAYYESQLAPVLRPGEKWAAVEDILRTPLPVAWREETVARELWGRSEELVAPFL